MGMDKILALGQTALELGLVNALTVLALFLSYTMLNVCDLSTDGCFTLGAAVGALVALAGYPWLSLPAAMLAGMASGFVTATLQMRMGVQSLLAGIVVNTALYSVNMAMTGNKATLSMNKTETVFTMMKDALAGTALAAQYKLIVLIVAVALAGLFLCMFLRTKLGLAIRATGSNADMVRSSSINPVFTTTVGLCVSNSLTALSGCLMAQQQKSFDINMGKAHSPARAGRGAGRVPLPRGLRPGPPAGYACLHAEGHLLPDRRAGDLRALPAQAAALGLPPLEGRPGRGAGLMLKMTHVSKTFHPGTPDAKTALDDVNLHIRPGDFVSIIGANGAGKSTLFNAICGSFMVDTGSIFLDGTNITMTPDHRRAKVIGRLFQDPMRGSAPDMSIEENLALASGMGGWLSHVSAADRRAFRDRLSLLGMGLEDRMRQPVGLLSGGQRQALTLLMATYHIPKLLLLDEHTAALDPGTAEKVLKLTDDIVRENHITCLMITHNMQSALDLGNRTLMMHQGRVIYDVTGEERSRLTIRDLTDKFREESGKALDNDRMLLMGQE